MTRQREGGERPVTYFAPCVVTAIVNERNPRAVTILEALDAIGAIPAGSAPPLAGAKGKVANLPWKEVARRLGHEAGRWRALRARCCRASRGSPLHALLKDRSPEGVEAARRWAAIMEM
jgi:hypothetical protein